MSNLPPPPGPPNTNPGIHRELQALKRWRDQAVADGRLANGAIKDTNLTQIVQFARKDVREVRKILTASVQFLAEEIVEVQVAVSASHGPTEVPPSRSQSLGNTPGTGPVSPAVHAPRAETVPGPARSGLVQAPTEAVAPEKAVPTEVELEHQRVNVAPRFARTRRLLRADPIAGVKIREVPTGLRLEWAADPDADAVTVYWVVSLDERPPHSPEGGQLVIITYDLKTTDIRPARAATRYVRVFSYTGASIDEAMEAQPRLVAESDYVFGLSDVDVHEEGGIITGQWPELAGATRVYLYRIPLEEVHQAGTADPRYLYETGETNLNGFSDRQVKRGRSYQYDFFVEASVGGAARLSDVTSVEVAVSASLAPVIDLAVTKQFGFDGSVTFNLGWTKPDAGEVVIYRTQGGPAAGATAAALDVSALPGAELREEDRLRQRVLTRDATQEIHDVSAKDGWSRIHLTPVTLLSGQARIGNTATQLVIGAPVEPEVVERCSYQLVKFGWPEGAATVVACHRPTGEAAALPVEGPGYAEIDKQTYDRLGGMQLARPLPHRGCSVHLAGVAYQAGEVEFGPPQAADYPGLTRLSYSVEQRRRFFRLDRVVVKLRPIGEPNAIPAFVLVHRPDRLPLHVNDGTALTVTRDVEVVSASTRQFRPDRLSEDTEGVGWSAGVRGLTGFVRLFVDDFSGRYALLDPPMSSLWLSP